MLNRTDDTGVSARLDADVGEEPAPKVGRPAVKKIALWLVPWLTLGCAVGLWEVVVAGTGVREYVLPSPAQVADSIGAYHSVLLQAAGTTVLMIIVGFAISVAAGLILGVGIAFSPVLERMLYPLLVASQAVPKVAVAPLFLLWFGFGSTSKIAMAATIGFFPIVLQTVVGMRDIDADVVNLARVSRASAWRSFYMIRLPNALPSLFSGLKMCITFSVIGVVVAEFVAGTQGLGYVIQNAQGTQTTDLAFAGIICLTVVSLILFYVVVFLEKRLIRR